MATNSLGTLATGLVIQRALDLVFTKRPFLRNISLDLSNEAVKYNQAVTSRIKSIPTVNTFGTGATNVTTTDVSVTINNFKEIHHEFLATEYSGTDRNLVDEQAEPIAVAIGNHMVDAVAALWTITNFDATKIVLANGWDYDHLVNVRIAMNKAGIPDIGRFYVGNADVYGSLLKDSTIVAALNNPANGEAIRTGQLPQVANFRLDEYPDLPTTGNMVAFAGTPDTCVLATRVPKDPRELLPSAGFPGNLGVVTNAQTGLSVMVNEWIDPSTLKVNIRIIWMYGAAKGNGDNGQLIVSQ